MPTYDYQCAKCKKDFEIYQSMKDAALSICPKELCRQKTWGRGKVKRAIGTGAGLLFKGSGFYITDYRSAGYQASAKSDSSAGETKAAEPKEAKKTETQSAAEKAKPTPKKKTE